jgi:ATP-binding cassette subfamily B protein
MRSLFRLVPFLRPYWPRLLLTSGALLGLTAVDMVFPVILRQVIDQGLAAGLPAVLAGAALLIVALGLGRASLGYLQRYNTEWVAHRLSYDLRNRLYAHVQRLPFSFHDRTQSGQLISRIIEDVRSIERFAGQGMAELARVGLLLVGIITLLLLEDATLALITLAPLFPLLLMTTRFGRRISDLFLRVDQALGSLSARLQENVSGVQVVRAFAREPHEIARFDALNRALYSARLTVIGEWAKIMPSTFVLHILSTILLLWFGGQKVLAGQLSLGGLVAFNSYLVLLAEPLQILAWLVNAAGEASAGVQRSLEILDEPLQIQSPPKAITLPTLEGRVSFRGVCFRYRAGSQPALDEVDLEVEPNQVVALVGPTGSGKTTLVNLIPRFYDVNKGAVLVDGVDVRQVDLHSLRRQIGIVLQTSLLFSTTLRENIAYGRPDAPLEEVIAAARAAQAHEFIEQLPDGYDTVVGERGVTLSGGQRQRVAIARALLLDPRILILDDSTSSVDTETEAKIQMALARLMHGRTTFVIAQRLSTIRRADLIVVMDRGRVVQRGTHAQLLQEAGLYRQVYELQFRDQERFQEQVEAVGQALGDGPAGGGQAQ